jgi:glycosyltransferase involved in cell wall biosynthesis
MNPFRLIAGKFKERRSARERRSLRENFSGQAAEITRAEWAQSLIDPTTFYFRCWPYHLAMKPFYQFAPQIWTERGAYASFPFWRTWLQRQPWPDTNVVQATMGFATELFDVADQTRALKVVDCPNSHPTTYFGYWQRECDRWCPGEKIPIPHWMFARMNRELERADLILCPSLFVRDTMVLNGIPPEKCLVNPFGVNIDIFKLRNSVLVRPKFVAIGTICVRKGLQYLFRAFEIVKPPKPCSGWPKTANCVSAWVRRRTKKVPSKIPGRITATGCSQNMPNV